MKKVVPVTHTAQSSERSKPVVPYNPVNVIQEITSLCVAARNHALRHPDNWLYAEVLLERLVSNIADLTGKTLIDNCALKNGTATNCNFAARVADEMKLMMSATEKCIGIIDGTFVEENYVYGLTAARELLDAINASSFKLLLIAPDSCISTDDKVEGLLDQG